MHTPEPQRPDVSAGFEKTDVNVKGILVFLVSLGVFVGVFFVFCFGMGKVINTAITKHDGPPNQWNQIESKPSHGLETLTSNATVEQQQLQEMTQRFPSPRLQMDDGDQDVADLHAREDLLLDHYSWVDRKQGKVRIPIERAMELIAKSGLPVAPAAQTQPLMAGDKAPVVPMPLTNGFARTGHEQEVLETLEQQRERSEKRTDQAALQASH
ncbi:MAG TPA: hypothetical protein VGR96_11050 [Acidobacteriaceae bacterium]|nr:hypothetical protein [Acidobacteriaceae bacterium]